MQDWDYKTSNYKYPHKNGQILMNIFTDQYITFDF
jgi:hypothetical protein